MPFRPFLPPVAVDDSATTTQGMPVVIDLLANDYDLNGDTITINYIDEIRLRKFEPDIIFLQNGYIEEEGNGLIKFTPNPGFVGTLEFTYTINDRNFWINGRTAEATVTIEVTGDTNIVPVAADDTAFTGEDTAVTIDVLANDTDSDGGLLSVLSVDAAGNGTVSQNPDGTLTYTPDTGYVGADSFAYTVTDGQGGTDTAIVTINVGGGNAPPVATDDAAAIAKDTAVTVDVLANDTDADSDALTVIAVSPASNGTVAENPDGTLTYTPDFGFVGTDSFAYIVADGNGGTDVAGVSINVSGGNAPPVAADDAVTTDTDTPVKIDVLANDTDSDSDSLDILTVGAASNGTVSQNPDGTLTYTPDSGFAGIDTFLYTAVDESGGTDTATVTIDVNAAGSPHDPSTPEHDEHIAVLNLVKHSDVTHTAINNGSWFDPATWAGNSVPGDDARVLISDGVVVDYDAISNDRLMTVRVDGELRFSTSVDSKMVVDTLFVDQNGTLTAGTESNPVAGNVNVDIVIADNGDIDVAWDPQLISRGFISHGTVEIHGQEKDTHLKVAVDPLAGETSLTLAEVPVNWQIGDTIVLTGTQYDGYVWANNPNSYRGPQDEVLTISDINGDTVFFDSPLQFDHKTPRADLKASVANYTRNVSIESENGSAAETHHRGHVMFMHSDNVDVRFAEFSELGRTDKSILALNPHEFSNIASDSNVKGRYSFHLHKAGIDDPTAPAIAEGNAVFGSPGWGFVHHDSHAILNSNATYDTFGAGYVAESGNETGSWTNNIAIFAKGVDWSVAKNQNDGANFDTGKGGDGFFFQGRMIKAVDNIAASVNHGFTYFHRGRYEDIDAKLDGQIRFDPSAFELPEALGHGPIDPNTTPILHFAGNEVFAANEGVHIIKNNPHQGHDIHSKLVDFTAWEVNVGAFFGYTGHYVLEDFDLIAKSAPARAGVVGDGIVFGQNAVDMIAINPKIDSFANGINLNKNFSFNEDISVTQYKIINPTFLNIANQDMSHFDPNIDELLTSSQLDPNNFSIDLDFPLFYDPTQPRVVIYGTKTDSVGEIEIPAGTDGFNHNSDPYGYSVPKNYILDIMEEDGYYSAGGKNYVILESYYTDRGTGEIHKTGNLVELSSNINKFLGSVQPYENAIYAGAINLNNSAPVTQDDSASTLIETDVVIDLLQNDWDADGDTLEVDGIGQPTYGNVFDNGDGTITYRPDLNFSGTETFKYWASDSQGGFTEGLVTVDVWGV